MRHVSLFLGYSYLKSGFKRTIFLFQGEGSRLLLKTEVFGMRFRCVVCMSFAI